MIGDDDDPGRPRAPAAPAAHVIGQSLDDLSVDELALRIAALHAEIERLEDARKTKEMMRTGAAAFFRPVQGT